MIAQGRERVGSIRLGDRIALKDYRSREALNC